MTGMGEIRMAKSVRTHGIGVMRLRSLSFPHVATVLTSQSFDGGKQMNAAPKTAASHQSRTIVPRTRVINRKVGDTKMRWRKTRRETLLSIKVVGCKRELA